MNQNNEQPTAAPAAEPLVLNTNPEPKTKKSKKWLFIILGIIAVIGITVAVLYACGVFDKAEADVFDPYENEVVLTFDSPEEQFDYIERNSILSVFGDADTPTVQYNSFQLHVLLGDTILNTLEEEAGVSLKWLNDILLTMDIGQEKDYAGVDIGLGLGDEKIATGRVIIDAGLEQFWIGVPELSDTFVTFDLATLAQMGGLDISEFNEIMSQAQATGPVSMISSDQLKAVVERYLDIFFDSIGSVESEETVITVDGVSQTVTKLTVSVSEKQFIETIIAVLNEAKTDEDLIGVIQGVYDYMLQIIERSGTEMLPSFDFGSDFVAFIDETVAVLEENLATAGTDPSVTWVDYVDARNHIVGRSLTTANGEVVHYLTATANGKFAFEADLAGYVQAVGSGTDKKGKRTGTYEVSSNGTHILTVEVKDLICANSYVSGTVRIIPDEAIVNALVSEVAGVGYPANVVLEISMNTGKTATDFGFKVFLDEALLVGLTGKISEKDVDFRIPKDSIDMLEDPEALVDWIVAMDFDEVIDNMKDAGVPGMYVNQIKTLVDLLPLYLKGE